jgi:hypothetical protein
VVVTRAALNAAIKNAELREEAARLVQSRLSAHIRPHAAASGVLGAGGRWQQSVSVGYGGGYLDLPDSPTSLYRPLFSKSPHLVSLIW